MGARRKRVMHFPFGRIARFFFILYIFGVLITSNYRGILFFSQFLAWVSHVG